MIYEVDSGTVAKLYFPAYRTAYREEKIRAMLKIPLSPELDAEVAWPKDILYDRGGFCGFVMRRVFGVPLEQLYSETYRDLPLPRLVTIAKNLCALVGSLHAAGVVIGDMNPNNFYVLPQVGLVRAIDTDSFHIQDGGKIYRCEVNVPQYLAPMVAAGIPPGETLKTVPLPTYSVESDRYSLAIHVFELLMGGTHPFAMAVGSSNSGHVPQLEESMRRYIFPYDNCPYGYKLPVYALRYKTLSERLQFMFTKTFSRGNVIAPEHWYAALNAFGGEITKVCNRNPAHQFRRGLRKCPYCASAKRADAFFKKIQKARNK